MKTFSCSTLFCAMAFMAAGLAPQARAGETFGNRPAASTFIPAFEFNSVSNGTCAMNELGSAYYIQSAGCGPDLYVAAVDLPEGALITGYSPMFFDNDADDDLQTGILRSYADPAGAGTAGYASVPMSDYLSTGAMPSFQSPVVAVGATGTGHTFDSFDHTQNRHYSYQFYAVMPAATEIGVSFRGVLVYWQRQIAPAPATASFGDVPTSHPFFNQIEQLSKSGITAGCGGGNFCPNAAVTRGQMAVFLSKSLGLHWDFVTNAAP